MAPGAARFGPFEWDPASRELRKHGVLLHAPEQSLAILDLLIEARGELVTRDQIRRRLWPDGTVVEYEHGIGSALNRLRAVLGDSAAHPRFIETLPRRGYRLVVPVGKTSPATAPAGRHRVWVAAATLVLAAFLAGSRRPSTAPHPHSIAVLPLQNLSGLPEDEALAGGLTAEIISRLARIRALRVVASTSIMRYGGEAKSAPAIARELGVARVVEGALERGHGRVRVTVRLIDGASGRSLGSEFCERPVEDMAGIRDHVSSGIAAQMGLGVSGPASRPAAPGAYEAYLRGRYFAARLNLKGQTEAAAEFEAAVAADPAYAPAWAGLAHALGMLDFWDDVPPRQRSRFAMQRALDLAPGLAEAHVNFADARFYSDWDWPGGEAAFRRVAEMDPGSVDARDHYAVCLRALGRFDEAAREARAALRLDPVSPSAHAFLAAALSASGNDREALPLLIRATRLDPSYSPAWAMLARCQAKLGRTEEAADALLRSESLAGRSAETIERIRGVARREGYLGMRRALGRERLAKLTALAAKQRVSPRALAAACAEAGEAGKAMDWLEKAYAERCPTLAWLKTGEQWDGLRGEPRFQALLARMGFAPN